MQVESQNNSSATSFKPPEKKAILRDIIVEQIRDLITTERLQRGQRLPPERTLALRFAVSRHVVREALRVLEQQQVIVSKIGSGSYVENIDSVWLDRIITQDTLRKRSNFMEILEFRRSIEPRIAYLAANRVTDCAKKELGRIIVNMRKAVQAGLLEDWYESDAEFHSYLAVMSGNFLYEKTVVLLHQAMVTFSNPASPLVAELITSSLTAHEAIAEHVFNGQGKKAAKAMEEHVVSTVRAALAELPN